MRNKKDNFYFIGFTRLVEFANQAALLLHEIISNYDNDKLSELKEKMHSIEHSADLETHLIIEKLSRDLVTPIDREDIIKITQKIDDVTDAIEDVLLRLYMYNVTAINQNLREFSNVICDCCKALTASITEFANFKRSTQLKDSIILVSNLEEIGDRLYINSVRELYTKSNDPRELLIWEELYKQMEKCCDACENVADALEMVIMKSKKSL